MILKNKTIFILGITKFDGSIESTSFTTAKFLAKNNDVFYIDFPYTLKDYCASKDSTEKNQFTKRKTAFFSKNDCLLDTSEKRLKVLILPPVLSINFLPEGWFYRALLAMNEQVIVNRIRAIVSRFQIEEFVFINSFNFHYPNIGFKLNARLRVYHCVDPLIAKYDRRHGLESEKILSEKSDLIVCTSKQLFREKTKINESTYFIPNAADLSHCSQALSEDILVHKSFSGIAKPIIGYFGNIERRIDFGMLQEVVLRNPKASFVFFGPVDENYVPRSFQELENVHFMGKVPHHDLPAVLKGFDVSMIPFKRDEVSATIFPLKLFEYLGAGKPVVATDFNPDLVDFTADTVVYCRNSQEFSDAVKSLVTLNRPDDICKRLTVAAKNTWDTRLTEFSELLSTHYERQEPVTIRSL